MYHQSTMGHLVKQHCILVPLLPCNYGEGRQTRVEEATVSWGGQAG